MSIKSWLAAVLSLLAVALLIGGAVAYKYKWKPLKAMAALRLPRPAVNGIEAALPPHNGLLGIDVSHHQGDIDWAEVRKARTQGRGLSFVFIKASEGTAHTDSRFAHNWAEAKRHGLPRGAYHFFKPHDSGEAQAQHFIATVGPLQPDDLAPVLDVEKLGNTKPQKLRAEVQAWLNTVEAHYGKRPIIYSGHRFFNDYLWAFTHYPQWLARYGQLQPGKGWAFWQFTQTGKVSGIAGRVDINVFEGQATDLGAHLVDSAEAKFSKKKHDKGETPVQ